MNRIFISFAIILFTATIPMHVSAYDLDGVRTFGMGGTILFSDPSSVSIVSLPGLQYSENMFAGEAGYSRKYGLNDLDDIFFVAAVKFHKYSFAIGLRQFGNSDLYSEKTLKVTSSYSFSKFAFGVSGSGMMVDFGGGYGQLRAAAIGVGALWKEERWMVALSGDNLNKPKLFEYSLVSEPHFDFYGEFVSKGSLSVTGHVRMQKDEAAIFGLGQKFKLSNFASLGYGFSTSPTIFGGTMQIARGKTRFYYAVSIHPVLGMTHAISLGFISKSKKRADESFD